MLIYIPDNHQGQFNAKELFLLTRPFYSDSGWVNDSNVKALWNLNSFDFHLTNNIEQADCVILPRSINYYIDNSFYLFLQQLNKQCSELQKKILVYVSGDFGEKYPPLSQFIYFRMGGFRSQLNSNYFSFPFALSDYLIRLYQTSNIQPVHWQSKPVVGFCGQANLSRIKATKEVVKFLKENVRRFIRNPFRKDYEPLFASGYQRAKLLKNIEKRGEIETRFIYREQYRAGANTTDSINKTTKEYYDNMRESQYIICIRGGGNFSVRFYQTLMMGRIPVFVNTDCLLPFDNIINWKKHVVWVEWDERHLIVDKIIQFHNNLSPNQLVELQESNRSIWLNQLSLPGMFNLLKNLL